MKLHSFTQLIRHYRHLFTIQNAGLLLAVIIALTWVWGAISTLQQNYQHQRQVDANKQRIELMKLQNETYQFQQAYYKSDEFLELSARAKLGKALPGEKLVILPSSKGVVDSVPTPSASSAESGPNDNLSKWMNFFFGPPRSQS